MGRSYLLQRDGAGNIPALVAMLKAGRQAALSSLASAAKAAKAGVPEAIRPAGELPHPVRQPSPPLQLRSSPSPSRPGSFGRQRTAPAGTVSPLRPSASGEPPSVLNSAAATADATEVSAGLDITAGGDEKQRQAVVLGLDGGRDGALLHQSLVALQKMSLRRQAQSAMIREGLLPWLVDFLQVSERLGLVTIGDPRAQISGRLNPAALTAAALGHRLTSRPYVRVWLCPAHEPVPEVGGQIRGL
jgi:hypothetical protein